MSPEEFSDFYAASFRRLVGHLYAMTGDRAEAQDAVQEAFVRAWSHRGQLDRDGAPDAWVRATAWRIAVSRRHRARRGRLLLRSHAGSQVTEGPTPDRVAFIDALREVPAEQRRALVLYYVCDLSVAQIATEPGADRRGRVMSELGDELNRLVGQGAEQARPLPAAEIIRRGDQRRRRRMAGGTVAGLAVAGTITGGILSGVAGGGRPAPDRPASRPVPATTGPATRSAAGTPVPVPSATSPSAVPSATRSGLQPVPTKGS